MEELRKCRKLNLDLPGCVELEHPNWFLDIRKIEEFRHTPIVPISEQSMAHYQQQVKNRKANKFTVVYTMDKFINIALFVTAIMSGYLIISYLLRRNDEMMTDFYRKKLAKISDKN